MNRFAIVTSHFSPSNLTGAHRARLWSHHLSEFGWEPIIVTTHWDFYEEELDWEMNEIVPESVEVIRTPALPTRPIRLVGDTGIRAFYWHYRVLSRLAKSGRIDFVLITVPSNFSSLLGRLVHRRHKIPYGIDYQDPWVEETPVLRRPLSKGWISAKLARVLEPWAVKDASLITGVADSYYKNVLVRNPQLDSQVVRTSIPIGGETSDHDYLRTNPRKAFLFEATSGCFNMIYAGAMLPQAHSLLKRFLEGLSELLKTDPKFASTFRLHFVGTGTSPSDSKGYRILPYIQKYALEPWVTEHPQRISYLDVLNHLQQASGILILGSTERHYTPSKVFQALLSRKPIFATLHESSTATQIIREARAGTVFSFSSTTLPESNHLARSLSDFVDRNFQLAGPLPPPKIFSARRASRLLAAALDQVSAFQNRDGLEKPSQMSPSRI